MAMIAFKPENQDLLPLRPLRLDMLILSTHPVRVETAS